MEALREAAPRDAAAIADIYRPFVLETTVSFEVQAPSGAEIARRIQALRGQFPWLVYHTDAGVQGYCYATRFGQRAGYDWSAESSIYLAPGARGRGAGRLLYTALFQLLTLQGYRTVYARISHPNPQSEGFHLKMGFELEGVLKTAGYKFGKSVACAYYAKRLLDVMADPPPPVALQKLPRAQVDRILEQAPASG